MVLLKYIWHLFTIMGLFHVLSGSLQAQQLYWVDDRVEERVFYLHELEFMVDSSNRLSFHDILLEDTQSRFKRHDNYQNADFLPNTSYWVRFNVKLNPASRRKWLLEFYDQTIDNIEIFIPEKSGDYSRHMIGDAFNFAERDYLHKNFEVGVDMFADTTIVCYLKVRSHEFADIRIAFRSVNRFVYYALNEYMLYGMFYGMILIICLYNFLIYLAIREIKNMYYIAYSVSVALYVASLDGVGFQYLWPSYPEFNRYAVGITLYSLIVWALIFTRRFLSTRAQSPELDRALQGMIIARTVLFLLVVFLFPSMLTYRYIEIVPLSLIFYTGLRVWLGGYKPARFFVIAYGMLITGFFMRALVYFNILPLTILSHYSLHISFGIEMLFLTFALGDRVRILKDNRDRALRRIIHQHEVNMQLKDKVNRELEAKVQERTLALNEKNHELEESNARLARQSVEINQINSLLDLDNWKLKNSIKEVLNERLLEKTMDYNQFKTLYPDALACYRFIENLKWERGYACKKCGNDRFFDGSQKFSRRCTRCGYNESITAFTIFHGLKFPIEKAFYLAYLTVSGKKDFTLEMLSKRLDLRVNTIWSFKHKVQERIQILENKGVRTSTSRWEEVVLTATEYATASKASRKVAL